MVYFEYYRIFCHKLSVYTFKPVCRFHGTQKGQILKNLHEALFHKMKKHMKAVHTTGAQYSKYSKFAQYIFMKFEI